MLSHHMVIRDGKIANYQPYPPTPWNAQPARRLRDARPLRGRGAEHADLRGERPGELQGRSTSCGRSAASTRACRAACTCTPATGKVRKVHAHADRRCAEADAWTAIDGRRRARSGAAGRAGPGADRAARGARGPGRARARRGAGRRGRRSSTARGSSGSSRRSTTPATAASGRERARRGRRRRQPAADPRPATRCRSRSGCARRSTRCARTWSRTAATSSCSGRGRRRAGCASQGSCKGCPASASTLELAIKQALEEAAPDLEGLEVEGRRASRDEPGAGAPSCPIGRAPAAPRPAPAWFDARRASTGSAPDELTRGRGRRARRSSSPTSRARCSPTATPAPAAAARSHGARADAAARSPARRASGASTCRAPAARSTTTGCSSSRCRCCAGDGRVRVALARDERGARRRRSRRGAARELIAGLRRLAARAATGRADAAGAPARPSAATSAAPSIAGRPPPPARTSTSGRSSAPARRCWALRSGDAELPPDRHAHASGSTASSCPTSSGRRSRSRSGSRSSCDSSVTGGVVALYPSPAGATESELAPRGLGRLRRRSTRCSRSSSPTSRR